jgi:hypothetical protein
VTEPHTQPAAETPSGGSAPRPDHDGEAPAAAAERGLWQLRRVDVILAALFGLLAVATLVESVKVGPGWEARGPQPGFLPFVVSAVIIAGSAVVIVQALRSSDRSVMFTSRRELIEVLKVGVPIWLAIWSVYALGFYLMVAAYSALFIIFYGRFRWYLVVPLAFVAMLGLHYALENLFRLFLPKSMFYPGLPM